MRNTSIVLTIALLYINLPLLGQWSIQNYGGHSRFNKTKFRSDTEGFMIGDHSLVLKTTDGGKNWASMDTGVEVFFQDFQFLNDSTLIGSGFYYEDAGENMQSKVLRSSDNGSTWQLISTLPGLQIYTQWFFNDQIGLLSGYGGAYRTSDGGISWHKVLTICEADSRLFFINDSVGFVSDGSKLLKSENAGESWFDLLDFENEIKSIHFTSDSIGFVGSLGKVYRTEDAGTSWLESAIVSNHWALSIDFISQDIGFAIGIETCLCIPEKRNFYTSVSKTIDGGLSWESYIYPGALYSADFLEEQLGYVSGADNLILNYTGGDLSELPAEYPWRIVNSTNQLSPSQTIFPNPVSDKLTIQLNTNERFTIQLYSLDGKTIETSQAIKGNLVELDLSHVPKAVYILKLLGSSDLQTLRILKK